MHQIPNLIFEIILSSGLDNIIFPKNGQLIIQVSKKYPNSNFEKLI